MAAAVNLTECPVCMENMFAPIFQCQTGHSLCKSCTESLDPSVCPICRQAMTQMRNWHLEEIIVKVHEIIIASHLVLSRIIEVPTIWMNCHF